MSFVAWSLLWSLAINVVTITILWRDRDVWKQVALQEARAAREWRRRALDAEQKLSGKRSGR